MSYDIVGVFGKNCTLQARTIFGAPIVSLFCVLKYIGEKMHIAGKNIVILGTSIVSLFYVDIYNSMTRGF